MKTNKKMWKIMCIFTIFLIIILVQSEKIESVESDDPDVIDYFDPTVREWYSLEDWELEVCGKWGGTEMPYHEDIGPTYLSQTTITLQGQKSEKLPDETTMYEVAYYIEDALNKSITFAVKLSNSENDKWKRVVAPTHLDKGKAKSGYQAYYLTEEFDQVQLGYETEGSDVVTVITVPIVDNQGHYVQSSSYGSSTDSSGGLAGGKW